ncbi:MAG: hypothetical protein ASARMPREDX12_008777 [Alectoria sarmentosa]|nr:MAG: hypothetical protein ASARMPREDX12_008777 [Alectoria sarmentosa]
MYKSTNINAASEEEGKKRRSLPSLTKSLRPNEPPGIDSTDLAGAGKKDVVSANFPPGTENNITETSASIELMGDAEEQPSQYLGDSESKVHRQKRLRARVRLPNVRDQEPLAQMRSDDDEDDDQRSHSKPHGDTAGQETSAKRRIQVQQIEGMPGQDIQDYSQLKRNSVPQPSAPAWTPAPSETDEPILSHPQHLALCLFAAQWKEKEMHLLPLQTAPHKHHLNRTAYLVILTTGDTLSPGKTWAAGQYEGVILFNTLTKEGHCPWERRRAP